MSSSPPLRPEKRTDYTNTQEAKLKHTIHTDRRKETNTQRGRERETRGEAQFPGGRRSRSRTSGMKHRQPGEREGGPRTADGPAQRSLSKKRGQGGETRERERERERCAHSCSCRTQTNRRLERCSGFQKVYRIFDHSTNMDYESETD